MKPRAKLRCVVCHSGLLPGAKKYFGPGTGDLYCPNSPGGFMSVVVDGAIVGVAHNYSHIQGWYIDPEDASTPGYVLCDPLVDLIEEAKVWE